MTAERWLLKPCLYGFSMREVSSLGGLQKPRHKVCFAIKRFDLENYFDGIARFPGTIIAIDVFVEHNQVG